jgi:hypothetical protein
VGGGGGGGGGGGIATWGSHIFPHHIISSIL